jgi:hypothetical protein
MVGLSPSHQYYNLHLMMTVFLLLLPMEPRLAPLGRPTGNPSAGSTDPDACIMLQISSMSRCQV